MLPFQLQLSLIQTADRFSTSLRTALSGKAWKNKRKQKEFSATLLHTVRTFALPPCLHYTDYLRWGNLCTEHVFDRTSFPCQMNFLQRFISGFRNELKKTKDREQHSLSCPLTREAWAYCYSSLVRVSPQHQSCDYETWACCSFGAF